MELQIPLPQWKIKNRHGVIQQRAIYRERNGPFRPAWFQLLIHLVDPTQFGQLGSPPPGSLEGATVRAHGRHCDGSIAPIAAILRVANNEAHGIIRRNLVPRTMRDLSSRAPGLRFEGSVH